MPELPEVEIVRQSLHKKIKKKSIKKVIIRNRNLRFKIPSDFESFLKNKKIIEVGRKLIDVACGTGDVGKFFLDSTNKEAEITCVDPNKGMVSQGKQKLSNYKNVKWVISPAEKLPITDNSFDYYTISFGLRNTKNLNKALSEAYRVLKPGGRYLCLEFSKIQNSNLDFIYKNYSKLIPIIGQFVVGEKEPYEYLIKSIEQFINQDELIELMEKNNFHKCSYRNLSGGIVSIHSGWKI